MSSLPHHSPLPHRFTPSQMLELTPSPPPLHQSYPVVVRHETPPTANEDTPGGENLPPEESGYGPIDNLSSSSEGVREGDGGEQGDGEREGDGMKVGYRGGGGGKEGMVGQGGQLTEVGEGVRVLYSQPKSQLQRYGFTVCPLVSLCVCGCVCRWGCWQR